MVNKDDNAVDCSTELRETFQRYDWEANPTAVDEGRFFAIFAEVGLDPETVELAAL